MFPLYAKLNKFIVNPNLLRSPNVTYTQSIFTMFASSFEICSGEYSLKRLGSELSL